MGPATDRGVCERCGKEVDLKDLEQEVQKPGGVEVDGVRVAKNVAVCSACNAKAREALSKGDGPDNQGE